MYSGNKNDNTSMNNIDETSWHINDHNDNTKSILTVYRTDLSCNVQYFKAG